MNTTIVLYGIVLIVLVIYALYTEHRVRMLMDDSVDFEDAINEILKQIEKRDEVTSKLAVALNEFDKRLDKFEFAVQRSENEINFADSVDAILNYNAMSALKAAKEKGRDA